MQNHPNAENRNITSALTIETHSVREGLCKTIETQKTQFRCSFWKSRCVSSERVDPAQTHVAVSPQFLAIDASCQRVVFRGHQSTLPCRPGTDQVEPIAVRHCWFSVTPGKPCVSPKVFVGGLRTVLSICVGNAFCKFQCRNCRCLQNVDLHLHL